MVKEPVPCNQTGRRLRVSVNPGLVIMVNSEPVTEGRGKEFEQTKENGRLTRPSELCTQKNLISSS